MFKVEQFYSDWSVKLQPDPIYLTSSAHELGGFKVNQRSVEPCVHTQVCEHEGELGQGVLHEEAG